MEIEHNIPIPPQVPRNGKYHFHTIPVDASVLYEVDGDHGRAKLASAVSQYAKRNGKKFTTRKVNKGIRVWRIA
jgi:hypothetical protein